MHPLFIPYPDTPDKYGRTLIQREASLLHLPSVRLLLEAGADAGVSLNLDSSLVLPLQIARAQARMLYVAFQGGLDADDLVYKRRAQAMEVASELLKWHLTRRDGHFEGITELHLARRMLLGDDEERLTKSRGMRQLSIIKGRWPGVEDTVTPYQLLKMAMPVEFDIRCMQTKTRVLRMQRTWSTDIKLLGAFLLFYFYFFFYLKKKDLLNKKKGKGTWESNDVKIGILLIVSYYVHVASVSSITVRCTFTSCETRVFCVGSKREGEE
jgi:hypothetical protein